MADTDDTTEHENPEEMPDAEELEEPSVAKEPGEEPKAPPKQGEEPSHHAVGIGVIDSTPDED
ncbi:hypothetical protein [Microbacterium sp. MM2322]|uniref:hypothetical protein n=1 Tax=Microbacterium sp. MM2322 TaxID=3157631 RepID=UPI0032D57B73